MVLTRRAARAARSSITRLPVELLDIIIRYLSFEQIAAVCQISRLFNALATPILYQSVTFNTDEGLLAFFNTMNGPSGAFLAPHIQHFALPRAETCVPGFEDGLSLADPWHEFRLYMPKLVADITASLLPLNNLRTLHLATADEVSFITLLRTAQFPHLTRFATAVQSDNSEAAYDFLQRHHRNLQHLDILHARPVEIRLYTTDLMLSHLNLEEAPLVELRIYNIDAEPARLHPNSIDPSTARRVRNVTLLCRYISVDTFDDVAEAFPLIDALEIQAIDLPRLITADEIIRIGTHLERFTELSTLNLDISAANRRSNEDDAIILGWHCACKTLSSVTFGGKTWLRENDKWSALCDPV
ncbi:hypothetical protein R3P38DRAFT_3495818 [Favolaschia claudopus]|uniref:F-box domain-containing protein n=1 Tax=Favolaschia claudopus TaxID=2862362 RepID=A0AAV9Z5S0_9AGAR